VLARQAGGLAPPLAEQPVFQAQQSAMFREALAYGWVNFKPVYDWIHQKLLTMLPDSGDGTMPLRPDKMAAALGFGGLQSVGLQISGGAEGSLLESYLVIPEADRQGIFKMITAEARPSGPPPFVPADAVKFTRWRLDGQKSWAALETALTTIMPSIAGFLQVTLSSIGKNLDPDFDFKKNFIGNLGNDFISYEKAPKVGTEGALDSPPSVILVGSSNPEALAGALKLAASSFFQGTAPEPKERELLGRKIHTVHIVSPGRNPAAQTEHRVVSLHFTAVAGYVGISTEEALIEELIRSTESSGKALKDHPGLTEAAQKVGGTETGLFGFESQIETMRVVFETVRTNSNALRKFFMPAPVVQPNPEQVDKSLKEFTQWFDFSLLPSFDAVAKYFHFTVYSGATTPEGMRFRAFAPVPPQMRK
jgi:hypothetical protein